MNEIKKLVDVKSIVTLLMTVAVIYLAVTGQTDIKDLYMIVIAFYFGTQSIKNKESVEHVD